MSLLPLPPFAVIGWTIGLVMLIVAGVAWLVHDERRMGRRLAQDAREAGGTREEAEALVSLVHRPVCRMCHDDGEVLVATVDGARLSPCSCELGDLLVGPVTHAGRVLRRRRQA